MFNVKGKNSVVYLYHPLWQRNVVFRSNNSWNAP